MDRYQTAIDELMKGIEIYIDSKIENVSYMKSEIGKVKSVVLNNGMYYHTVTIRDYDYGNIKSVGNNKFGTGSVVYLLVPNGQYNNMFILGHLDDTEANIKGGTISIGNGKFTVDSQGNLNINNKFTVDNQGNLNVNNGKFTVDNQGNLNATAGKIGDFTINKGFNYLTSGEVVASILPSTAGGIGGLDITGGTIGIGAGRDVNINGNTSVNITSTDQIMTVSQGGSVFNVAQGGANIYNRGGRIYLQNNVGTTTYFRSGTNDAGTGLENRCYFTLYTPNGTVSSSDKRLKKNIKQLDKEKSAKFIYSLKPSSYKYKENESNRNHHGFIAQEVKESMGKEDWGLFIEEQDENKTKGLRYEELIADIVSTLQYQKDIIDKQQEEINELKSLLKKGDN